MTVEIKNNFSKKFLTFLSKFLAGENIPYSPATRDEWDFKRFLKKSGVVPPKDIPLEKDAISMVLYSLLDEEMRNILISLVSFDLYEDDDTRKNVVLIINRELGSEGLVIKFVESKPVFKEFDYVITKPSKKNIKEFMSRKYGEIDFNEIFNYETDEEEIILNALNQRLEEINNLMKTKNYISSMLILGSMLEGIFYHIKYSCPNFLDNDEGIEGLNKEDIKLIEYVKLLVNNDFGEVGGYEEIISYWIRQYEICTHPYQQLVDWYGSPDKDTVKLGYQILKFIVNTVKKDLHLYM